MSLIKVDDAGLPQLTDDTAWLLGHELAHPYVNPMVDKHLATLAEPMKAAFDSAKDAMIRLHYTTPTIVGYESLARAIQVMYVSERLGKEQAHKVLDDLVKIGFAWSPDLVTALNRARAKNDMRLSEDAIVTALKDVLTSYGFSSVVGPGAALRRR